MRGTTCSRRAAMLPSSSPIVTLTTTACISVLRSVDQLTLSDRLAAGAVRPVLVHRVQSGYAGPSVGASAPSAEQLRVDLRCLTVPLRDATAEAIVDLRVADARGEQREHDIMG